MIIVFYYSERYWIPRHHGLAPKVGADVQQSPRFIIVPGRKSYCTLLLTGCCCSICGSGWCYAAAACKQQAQQALSLICYILCRRGSRAFFFILFKKEGFYDKIL